MNNFLWRLSPRTRHGFVAQLTARRSAAAAGDVLTSAYFGRVSRGPLGTAQGGQTSDATGTVEDATDVLVTGQETQTTTATGTLSDVAVVGTEQGGQTTTAAGYHDEVGPLLTAQGGQTSVAVGTVSAFRPVKPKGWLDAANVTEHQLFPLKRINPVPRSDFLAGLITRSAGASGGDVGTDAFFTDRVRYEYSDGIGGHFVSRVGRQDIEPYGFDSSTFGTHNAGIARRLTLTGFVALRTGTLHTIYNTAGALYPIPGFDSKVFGLAHVGNRNRYLRAFGIYEFEAGLPDVSHKIRWLNAWGRDQQEIGKPSLHNVHQTIQPLGYMVELVGEPSLKLMRQYILCGTPPDCLDLTPAEDIEDRMEVHSSIGPPQLIKTLEFATEDENEELIGVGYPIVHFWLQYIILQETTEMTLWGTAEVILRNRYIKVPGRSSAQWGLPTFATDQYLWLYGIRPGPFGIPHVELASQRLMEGWDSLLMGKPRVDSMRRYVKVREWEEKDKFGGHAVHNMIQHVQVRNYNFFDSFPFIVNYHDVRFRNRFLEPPGIDPPRVPNTHRAWLAGQQTKPTAGEQTLWGEATFIAFRIRHLYPTWKWPGFIDPYHYIRNAAMQWFVHGWDSQSFPPYPYHRVWFNAQHSTARGFTEVAFGRPFVADRVRWLQQKFSENGLVFGKPWISNYTRYLVQPPYEPPYLFGNAKLRIFKAVLKAFPILHNPTDYGRPTVKNVTPELSTTLGNQARYGDAWVSHAPRYPSPKGLYATAFGEHLVVFRTRIIKLPGILGMVVPWPQVRKEIADAVVHEPLGPFGIGPPPMSAFHRVGGQPELQGWDSSDFGLDTSIRMQGCYPKWSYPSSLFNFGFPIIIFQQVITQINKPDDGGDGSQLKFPKNHAVNPHTIWATPDTPPQARRNHPDTGPWEPIGLRDNPPNLSLPPWFGTASVRTPMPDVLQHHHGTDPWNQPSQATGEKWGELTRIENSTRYIEPVGFLSARYGFPSLPHPRRLWVFPIPPPDHSESNHIVGTPPDSTQWALAQTLGLTERFGGVNERHEVQLLNRPVGPSGFDATRYGNNFPMVYHYPRGPKTVGGDDHATFSDEHWVSHYVRYFQMEGFESFEEGYTFDQFEARMRVSREGGAGPAGAMSVGDALRMGYPHVGTARAPQRIGPYMIPPPDYCHPHDVELEEA